MTGCLKPSRSVIGDPSDGRRPFVVDFDSLFLDALLQAAPVDDESLATGAPPVAPLALVAFLERRMKALAASGKELHVVLSQELEAMWPTATLRFSRRVLWAHVRRLAMDDSIGLSLTAICLSGGAKELVNQLEATLPVCFLMEETDELALKLLQRRSLFHNLEDCVTEAMSSLDSIQYALLHIKMRVLHASVAVVHFSDVSMAGATISGICQVYNGDRAALLEHMDHWAKCIFPSVTGGYDTVDNVHDPEEEEAQPGDVDFTESRLRAEEPSSAMVNIRRVLEAAVSHAVMEGHISAAAQRVWELHSLIIQTAPLSLRALAPITGDWHQVASVIEEVLITAMEIMDASFTCPVDALADPSCIDAYDPRLLAFLSLPRHQQATRHALQLSLEDPAGEALPWGMSLMPAHRVTGQAAGSNILINHIPALKKTKMFRALEDAGINWGGAEAVFSVKPAADVFNGQLETMGGISPSEQFYGFYNGSLLNTEQGNALELHDRHWHNNRPLSMVDWCNKLASDREQNPYTRFENLTKVRCCSLKLSKFPAMFSDPTPIPAPHMVIGCLRFGADGGNNC